MYKRVIIILFCIIVIISLYFCIFYNNNYSKDFDIDKYISTFDKDNDGIDDQSDILNNALIYINNRPKYKSKYYIGGYPNDGFGVCTDVVGYALLNSGYDLRKLVNEDIINNRESYNIDKVDIDIDFRRVVNLNVYFRNNFINKSLDIYDIDDWQGGDIVVFNGHIGIVSDRRNNKGIPLVIHHQSVLQTKYVEDILEKRKNNIIGHYRIS